MNTISNLVISNSSSTTSEPTQRSRRSRKRIGAIALLVAGALSQSVAAQSDPYISLGGGLAGTSGVPVLEGWGSLYPGTTTILRATNAQPQSTAILSLSFALGNTPAFGGSSMTLPSALTMTAPTDGDGNVEFPITVPNVFSTPTNFYVEVFVFDAGGPQGVAFTNAVRGTIVPETVIPDAAVFFDSVLTEAYNVASAGHIPFDLYNLLAANAAFLESNAAAVLDLVTPMRVLESPTDTPTTIPGHGGGGGATSGLTWVWTNVFGFEIARASLSVPWTSDGCHSSQGDPAFGGGIPLGTFTASQVGLNWTNPCPPKEQCPGGTSRECGNYQICWRQTFVWFLTLSSGCTKPEVICAPCP